jgi:hypothetical protein
MPLYTDINSFPEAGFPVLSDQMDRIVLNALYINPLRAAGFIIDVVGANRLLGALTLGGAVTGVTNITMAGTLATVTNLTMSGTLAMGSGDIATLGSIGTIVARVKKAWLKDLEVTNTPTVQGEPVALSSDIWRTTHWGGNSLKKLTLRPILTQTTAKASGTPSQVTRGM